jgi:hypothetical protein
MKNCFQFFFTPILSFALLFLLFGINKLINSCCQKDIGLISNYLWPRAPLQVGAYTLVQALPVSFFFFAQLNDTTYRHPLQPNSSYPTFNTSMAYGSFFATTFIPLMLMSHIYFSYNNKYNKISDANNFKQKFVNLL